MLRTMVAGITVKMNVDVHGLRGFYSGFLVWALPVSDFMIGRYLWGYSCWKRSLRPSLVVTVVGGYTNQGQIVSSYRNTPLSRPLKAIFAIFKNIFWRFNHHFLGGEGLALRLEPIAVEVTACGDSNKWRPVWDFWISSISPWIVVVHGGFRRRVAISGWSGIDDGLLGQL